MTTGCRKTRTALAAAAVGLLLPAAAAADGNVRIYGRFDAGPLYESKPRDGVKWELAEISANRLGFIGEEDLGGGMTAFFRLEHRFYLDTGAERSGRRFWTDKSWVGIGHKDWGRLSAGRVLTVGNTIVGGGDFEAMTDSVGAVNSRKGRIENNIDNGLFYESPWLRLSKVDRLRLFAQYTLTEVDGAETPYSLGLQYRRGPLRFDFGYQHDAYRDGSSPALEDRKSDSTFGGVAYNFGTFELKGTLARSEGYAGRVSDHSPYRMRTASLSFNKVFGKWELGLSGSRKSEVDTRGRELPTINQLNVGHWYSFSKRTTFMPTLSYERLSGAYVPGSNGYGVLRNHRDNLYVQVGIRHEF